MDAPVFVKLKRFKELLATLEEMEQRMHRVRQAMGTLVELKREEDAKVEQWQGTLTSIEEKLHAISEELRKK